MILREQRETVITFIDYSAAFDTESQLFLDEVLSQAGVSTKIRRIIQGIFHVAQGCVRQRSADGTFLESDMFDISRGVLQGDVFSAVAFIIGIEACFAVVISKFAASECQGAYLPGSIFEICRCFWCCCRLSCCCCLLLLLWLLLLLCLLLLLLL